MTITFGPSLKYFWNYCVQNL